MQNKIENIEFHPKNIVTNRHQTLSQCTILSTILKAIPQSMIIDNNKYQWQGVKL